MQLDDLKIGQLVTVDQGPTQAAGVDLCGELVYQQDRRLNGVPLVVVAVDLPYLIVRLAVRGWRTQQRRGLVLDSRQVRLRRVSRRYAHAYEAHILGAGKGPGLLADPEHFDAR